MFRCALKEPKVCQIFWSRRYACLAFVWPWHEWVGLGCRRLPEDLPAPCHCGEWGGGAVEHRLQHCKYIALSLYPPLAPTLSTFWKSPTQCLAPVDHPRTYISGPLLKSVNQSRGRGKEAGIDILNKHASWWSCPVRLRLAPLERARSPASSRHAWPQGSFTAPRGFTLSAEGPFFCPSILCSHLLSLWCPTV